MQVMIAVHMLCTCRMHDKFCQHCKMRFTVVYTYVHIINVCSIISCMQRMSDRENMSAQSLETVSDSMRHVLYVI